MIDEVIQELTNIISGLMLLCLMYLKQVIKTQFKEKHFQTSENAVMEARERKVASNRPGPKLFSGWSSVVVVVVS